MDHLGLLSQLAQPAAGKIVLIVLDGIGDLATAAQPRTPLELAQTPTLDALAARSSLGRTVPVATGITPGSGPGHLALFGYDPLAPDADVGRGAFEALGMDLDVRPGDVVARGNFATRDAAGNLTDRRAGRIPTAEGVRLCAALNQALAAAPPPDLDVAVYPGEGYRFVVRLRGSDLSSQLEDTDPQQLGVAPLALGATPGADAVRAASTIRRLLPALSTMERALAAEPQANGFLLRGFAGLPEFRSFPELYQLRAGCFAGYPLYRGVARAVGMEVLPALKTIAEQVAAVRARWADFDFFFLHVKGTDMAGEDGNPAAKARVIEEVDASLGALLAGFDPAQDVLVLTGDHSTPAPMKAHSWHPVPLLIHGPQAFIDQLPRWTERTCAQGTLGTFPARELMGLLLAHAGRLRKFGA